MAQTPPFGYPVAALIKEMRDDIKQHGADLRSHIEKDERDTGYIRRAQDDQSRELGKQTLLLSQILEERQNQKELQNFETKTSIKLKGNIKGWVWKALIGVGAAIAGAAIQHWWPG